MRFEDLVMLSQILESTAKVGRLIFLFVHLIQFPVEFGKVTGKKFRVYRYRFRAQKL